jgi:hypothetical protein
MIMSSDLRSTRASQDLTMLPLWRYSRRVSRQGSFPAAMVWKLCHRRSPPGKKNPGFFIATTSSCSSGSSILGAHSPSNVSSNASSSLAHLIRGGQNPLAPTSTSTTAPVKSELTNVKLGQTHHGKCYRCGGKGHWAWNCPQKGTGPQCGGALQQRCQIRVADTLESRF